MSDMIKRNKDVSPIPSDDYIRDILTDRVDVRRQNLGIVTGVISTNGRKILACGRLSHDNPAAPDDNSVFEIGSITKVFTRLLLVEMVEKGEVSLGDPVAGYLPSNVSVPERNGRSITLLDLATHTSGLPRVPENIDPFTPGNPYENYPADRLYDFLSHYELTRDIGTAPEYSNLGFGLLGHALARRADMDYESLLRTRICDPLGLYDTRVTLTPSVKERLAPGHDPGLTPIENWDFGVLAGAAGIRSTANNLLTFLAAYFGLIKSPLEPVFATAHARIQNPDDRTDMKASLGWGIITTNGKEIVYHTGGTGGYRSIAAFDIGSSTGVVVLSNTGQDVHDIGLHLLDSETTLMKPPAEHREKIVDAGIFDFYTGRYRLDPEFGLIITREGNRLFAKMSGIARYEIFPEDEQHFFFKAMDSQITFVTGEDGQATELIFSEHGDSVHIKRVER